ncbi:MAG TPA: hypothetical protein VFT34_16810 [Verrucomicrobiae bacterium]|nr:hypothetical protein [Verrucomicrobiae bacterium]
MKRIPLKTLAVSLLLLGLMAGIADGVAAAAEAKAPLLGLLGTAEYSRAGGPFVPVKKGAVFAVGDVIKTERGSAVDIFFGPLAGTVRLTESTTLVIEKSAVAEGQLGAATFELNLSLREGEILGRVERHGGGSRFQVKLPAGLAGIVEGQFRIDARGYVVLLDGKAGYVHIPASGEPVSHTLQAPPATYFSPVEGVQPAPVELVREVTNQNRSKLPKG